MRISSVHRICSRRKRLTFAPPIGSVASVFAIYDVGSDGQDRLGVKSIAIRRIFPELAHESTYDPGGNLVDAIVVVSKLREFALYLEISDETGVIPNDSD